MFPSSLVKTLDTSAQTTNSILLGKALGSHHAQHFTAPVRRRKRSGRHWFSYKPQAVNIRTTNTCYTNVPHSCRSARQGERRRVTFHLHRRRISPRRKHPLRGGHSIICGSLASAQCHKQRLLFLIFFGRPDGAPSVVRAGVRLSGNRGVKALCIVVPFAVRSALKSAAEPTPLVAPPRIRSPLLLFPTHNLTDVRILVTPSLACVPQKAVPLLRNMTALYYDPGSRTSCCWGPSRFPPPRV